MIQYHIYAIAILAAACFGLWKIWPKKKKKVVNNGDEMVTLDEFEDKLTNHN
jgi:hypothetical protein